MAESNRAYLVSPDRKRLHEAVALDETGHANLGSLPESKRLKINETKQESRDLPAHSRNEVNATTRACIAGQESSSHNIEGGRGVVDGSAQTWHRLKKTAGATPSINWNAGSKANIRISFGRGSIKSSKNESHGINSMGEISRGLQPKEQQVDDKFVNSTSTDRPSSLQQRLYLEHEESNQVPDPRADDIALRVSTNDHGELGLTVTDSGYEEHVNSSPIKPIPIDDDLTARVEKFTDAKSENSQPNLDVESEGGVILSFETSGDESGEISESEARSSGLRGTTKIPGDLNLAKGNATRSESTDDDAMMVYSISNPVSDATEHGHPPSARVDVQRRVPTVLSDLNPDELKLQLRYFYITRSPDRVDPSNPVRCLVCARDGHMAEACNTLTCAVCGKYDQHFTKDCAQVKRCWKCRERGHPALGCPRKVRPGNRPPVVCDLCQRPGHIEDDCELIWRTSGRPWESDLRDSSIRLGCYECGRSGHLGNDCPSRMPGKRPGTSSWSLNGTSRLSMESEGGITIKGRAAQQKAIALGDSDDDKANFFHPKVPGPIRKGQIHIATQRFSRHPTSLAPGEFSNWEGRRDGGFSNRSDKREYNSRSNDRRSISPHYSGRGGSYRNPSVNQPPLPRGQPPGRASRNISHQITRPNRAGESYRPMTSAARGAWVRHRT